MASGIDSILVVEDDEALAGLIGRLLRDQGLSCRVVHNLALADQEIAREIPRVIVADRRLPDGDGAEWLRRTKQLEPRIEVILLSADPLPSSLPGVSQVMTKPFEVGTLVGRIRQALGTTEDAGLLERIGWASEMCSHLAHALKNRVAAAQILAQIFESTPSQGDGCRLIKNDDVKFLVDQLNDLNRMISEVGWFSREPSCLVQRFDLREIAQAAATAVAPLASASDVTILLENISGEVTSEPTTVERMLERILRNAVEGSPRGGQVSLSSGMVGQLVEIVVQDQGSGMTEEARRRAFEPFFTTRSRHLGLGLAACFRDARRLGGRMEISASPNSSGTRMTLTLPQ